MLPAQLPFREDARSQRHEGARQSSTKSTWYWFDMGVVWLKKLLWCTTPRAKSSLNTIQVSQLLEPSAPRVSSCTHDSKNQHANQKHQVWLYCYTVEHIYTTRTGQYADGMSCILRVLVAQIKIWCTRKASSEEIAQRVLGVLGGHVSCNQHQHRHRPELQRTRAQPLQSLVLSPRNE